MTRTATRKTRKAARFSSIISALTVLGLLVFMASPALAHHRDDHTQGQGNQAGAVSDHDGDADSSGSTAYTEDNDTGDYDDPNRADETNNIEDDGDNAHPSGKDRSVESGGSGTQGKSESNPDDSKGPMRYEGKIGDDKANGAGGVDRADQDGNNGCGNDDDFDDDNNGHCGRPAPATPTKSETPPVVLPSTETKVCPLGTDRAGQPMATIQDCNDEVLGRVDNAEPVERDDDVLGIQIRNAAPTAVAAAPAAVKGAVLPFTGGAILGYVFAALGLMAAGLVTLRIKK